LTRLSSSSYVREEIGTLECSTSPRRYGMRLNRYKVVIPKVQGVGPSFCVGLDEKL